MVVHFSKQTSELKGKENKDKEKGLLPEVSIGLVGHVDHGKCIAIEEPILLNNDLYDGSSLINEKCISLEPEIISESERLYNVPNLRAFSLDPNFDLTSVPAKVFVQNYQGDMIEISTKDGKRLKASPNHPLLVNTGRDIIWKRANDLKEGDFVGAVKELPENSILKDPVPEWEQKIEKDCWIVTKERAKQLEEKTDGFRNFSQISTHEMNEIRILNKISFNKIQKNCKGGHEFFSASFKKNRLTLTQRKGVIDYFSTLEFRIPEGTIINCRHKSQCFVEIPNAGFNDEIIRFLALIIAEGYLTKNTIKFSQAENELLSDFLKICETYLKVKPVYDGRFDYSVRNKAFVKFLEVRYKLQTGNSHESSIPNWIFSLPNNKLSVFLRTFFSAEGNVNKRSNQIALIQSNKKSIYLIGYALKKFGINNSIHPIMKRATNSDSPKREYWQLLISDLKSLCIFREKIGFDLKYKHLALDRMCSRVQIGKKTDYVIPIQFEILSELIDAFDFKIKKNYLKRECKNKPSWIFAYRDCRVKNSMSEDKLRELLKYFESKFTEIESANYPCSNDLENRKVKARQILNRLNEIAPKNIEWCKIKSVKKIEYRGPIIDLQIPGYHNFICGIGALISHNTSLTQALTGKWTDTHSEEMKRGITIRLGYADVTFSYCDKDKFYCNTKMCPKCFGEVKPVRTISIIDAPGHETLMATVLSGAALMDGAILVISADEECPQPQTAEHLKALDVVGIKNVIIVQNKIDLVSAEAARKNYEQIRKFVKGTIAENAPIIPISAIHNANIDLLIGAIQENIKTPERDEEKPSRFYVARSFDINRPGTLIKDLKGAVIGGSVTQGIISVGDEVEIKPGIKVGEKWIPLKSKIIEIFQNGPQPEARPGGLVALQTELDPSLSRADGLSGAVAGQTGKLPNSTDDLKMKVTLFDYVIGVEGKQAVKPIRNGDILMITAAIAKTVGAVNSVAKGIVQVKLKLPVVVEKGDKTAISMQVGGRWHLVGYGIVS